MDGAGAPLVAMVNQAFVRRYLPGANAIGRVFRLGDRDDAKSYEIVGVLEDARFHNARDPIEPIAFMALLQDATQFALSAEAAVQTSGDPAAAANELRQAIAEVDRNVPVNDPRPLAAQVAQSFDTERLAARLVTAFGALALLLACVGLYGVVSQAVARRTNEIGVRMALGAERRDVLWMILRETLTLVGAGVAVGLPAALAGARLVRSQLFGLGAADPASFTSAAIVLTIVAVAAALFPARRASRVDPMVALRYE
jgi:ABC-type antimicrobial peptide transport system permease subunit